MKSPFPGMNPYLEPHWPGLHTQLVSLATTELNHRLPDDLVARPEERLSIESSEETSRTVAADVMVYQPGGLDLTEGGVAVSAPYKLVVEVEPITERFIRIIRADDGRLVTVIEFISPANKTGDGLEQYRQKRDELLSGGVHVVEVDLVRRGNWRGLLRPHLCPVEAVAPYRVTIRVGGRRSAYLYPIPLRQPLPSISVPLRPGDKEVRLDLQPLLDQAYENGRYGRTLDYGQPPDPPLEADEAAWAEARVKAETRGAQV
jgi:hypothetical protein